MYTINLILSSVYKSLVIAEKILPGIVIALFAFGIAKYAGKKREKARIELLSDFIWIWIENSIDDVQRVNELMKDELKTFDSMEFTSIPLSIADLDMKRVLALPNDDLYSSLIKMKDYDKKISKRYQGIFYNLIKTLKRIDETLDKDFEKNIKVILQANISNLQQYNRKHAKYRNAELEYISNQRNRDNEIYVELDSIIRKEAADSKEIEKTLFYANQKIDLFNIGSFNLQLGNYERALVEYTDVANFRKSTLTQFKKSLTNYIESIDSLIYLLKIYESSLRNLPFKKWYYFAG